MRGDKRAKRERIIFDLGDGFSVRFGLVMDLAIDAFHDDLFPA